MPNNERSVFFVRPPENLEGKFVLLVYKGSTSPFGGSSQPSVFNIDRLDIAGDNDGYYVGLRYDKKDSPQVICQFPASTAYLMVASNLVSAMTPLEATVMQKAEEDELGAIYKDKPAETEPVAVKLTTGQYM